MNDLISVIIPVFNCENYIERCLNSIINQDYKNLQIVIIDDGSTDHTLDKISLIEDKRIQLVKTKKIGVSGARNLGLTLAIGRYVMFIDADDWLNNHHAIQALVNSVHKCDYDFVISEYSRKSYKDDLTARCTDQYCCTLSLEDVCKKIINPFGFYGSVWAKIFDNEIINKYHLKFNEQIAVGEDLLFTFDYLKHSNNVGYLNVETYNYYLNRDSVLNNTVSKKNLYKRMDILKVYEMILNDPYLEDQNCCSRTIAIYTRELCDWYSTASYFNRQLLAKNIRRKIQKNLRIFLHDYTFSIKTKLIALLKIAFPKLSYKIRNKI